MKRLEIENYEKYHIPGCANYVRRPKNAIYISTANTIAHEFAKLKICYDLRKKGRTIITEAVPNNNPKRRIDIVDLTTGEEIEIEKTGEFKSKTRNYKVLTQQEFNNLINKNKVKKSIKKILKQLKEKECKEIIRKNFSYIDGI